MSHPFVIGVTGNIACGKSAVARELAALGAATIDADAVYHELIEPGRPLWQALRERFGAGIVGADGRIDRRALGATVFADSRALADLDRLTHPAILIAVQAQIAASPAPVVAVAAVKLVESGMDRVCDRVWLVRCDREQQVERLVWRSGLSHEDAERRVAAQPATTPEKIARVDTVIDNSGDPATLRAQVTASWHGLGAAMHAAQPSNPRPLPV